MFYTKFQPNISSGFGEKVGLSGLAIFSNSRHFLFLTRPNLALQPHHDACEI